jgi:hypothetical protein
VPFDAEWFNELRGLSQERLQQTRARGIDQDHLVPHVGDLCEDGHVSARFLNETTSFVQIMLTQGYRFNDFFRAYPRHIVNWPSGRAFRKPWNIGFTAAGGPDDDHVRIGIGFRLSRHENDKGIEDYLLFQQDVQRRSAQFDEGYRATDSYYELWSEIPPAAWQSGEAPAGLSAIIIGDQCPLDGWRFFGRRLCVRNPGDNVIIGSHERLRDAAVEVYNAIKAAGFGM